MFNKRPEDNRPIEAFISLSPISTNNRRLVYFQYDSRTPNDETVITKRQIRSSLYNVTEDNVNEKTWDGGLMETHFTPPYTGLPHRIHDLDQEALRMNPERFYPYIGKTITSILARYALQGESADFFTVFSRDIKKTLPELDDTVTYTFMHEQDIP